MSRVPATAALTATLVALMIANGASMAAGVSPRERPDMTAREGIRQRFDLGAAPSITVRGIGGPVTVETGPGSIVDVDIVRLAATERELQCYRTQISHDGDNLVIEHVQYSSRPGCDSIRSRQNVRLRLPRSASLQLSTIGGRVDIGSVDGLVRLDSIAGHVTVAAARAVEISSLTQGLSLTLAPLSDRGVQVSSVVGEVELNIPRAANADVQLSSVQGSVGSDWPARSGSDGLAYRIGAGGADVSVSSVVGRVRLRRF